MAERTARAILCPNCGKLVSATAEECIHCGMKNPGRWHNVPLMKKLLGGQISYVRGIMIVCIVLYVIALLIDPSALFRVRGIFQLLSPSGLALYLLGMTGSVAIAEGKWWTIITAMYLHGGLLHIFFNLLWIRQLGPVVEELFGSSRFFLIFTLSGMFGFIVSNAFGIRFTIGASGAIFGLLGAVIFYGRHRGGAFGTHIYRQTIQWVVILFLLGFMMDVVNNFAHAGGFVAGYVAAMLLKYQEIQSETLWHRRLALLSLALTAFAFLMVVLSLFV